MGWQGDITLKYSNDVDKTIFHQQLPSKKHGLNMLWSVGHQTQELKMALRCFLEAIYGYQQGKAIRLYGIKTSVLQNHPYNKQAHLLTYGCN